MLQSLECKLQSLKYRLQSLQLKYIGSMADYVIKEMTASMGDDKEVGFSFLFSFFKNFPIFLLQNGKLCVIIIKSECENENLFIFLRCLRQRNLLMGIVLRDSLTICLLLLTCSWCWGQDTVYVKKAGSLSNLLSPGSA